MPDAAPTADILDDYRSARDTLQTLADRFAVRQQTLTRLTVDGTLDTPSRGVTVAEAIHIRCLGSFQVEFEGQVVDLGVGGKSLTLLKILATRGGRPVSREQLTEALWSDADATVAANRLRVATHRLRGAMPERTMIRHEQGALSTDL